MSAGLLLLLLLPVAEVLVELMLCSWPGRLIYLNGDLGAHVTAGRPGRRALFG